MSAINLRNVKRDFAQLNYRPDVCYPGLIDELKSVLKAAGLAREYDDTALSRDINSHSLIEIIKRVCKVCYSDTCDEKTAIDFLTFLAKIYIEYCVNDSVRRSVTKCLKSCPEKWHPNLSTAISFQFVSIMESERELCEIEYILITLNECCIEFPNYVSNCIEKAMVFFEHNLQKSYGIMACESSPTRNISAIRCIHEGLRFFLTAYKKNLLPNNISVTLNECFTNLLDSDNLPMETLLNCCYSIVYSMIVYMPALECWNTCLDQLSVRSDLIKLAFCCAILNAFTDEGLIVIDPCSGKSICANLYNILMDSTTRNINDTSILLSSSRVLFLLSKRLCTNRGIIDVGKNQLESLINFLFLRLDHFLDNVRHSARDSMVNIIKMKDEHVLNYTLKCLSITDINSKAFFIVLTILSDKEDAGLIIKYLPNISDNLLHFMSPENSAVTIFINLMSDHYKTAESKLWFDYWLLPLFKNAEKIDVKYFEQIITKAVELTSDVSKHIYHLSNQNELSLKMYLICFNIEKKMYLASDANGNWMSQSHFETLKAALHNKDENIHYMALHLILDCQKKTQPLTDKELELMKYFITYNMKNEKPSIKQKNLSFVKKMLLRMKESQFSTAVRNNESLSTTVTTIYKEFQQWFCNFCFDNLFSDATFSRRNFSLESLHLIQICLSPIDIIKLNEPKNAIILLNCLWDTYEQNKMIAKNILIYKNQEPMKLDNIVKLDNILKKSKMLASSTSPPNCVTAGYLLEVLIALNQNINCEEYTFVILSDLMDDLIKEVELAEESLNLASAKGPMYGLVHVIRHLLNTLNWENHCLNKNWITFIGNLSTLCLKCVNLVSIVVNDSSPEGIIPMDDLCQNDCQVTSQMVLLCCWRTTKESSLLLGDIVGIIASQESEFSNTLITQICSRLTLLLSEIKHRGAFEQINVAYLKVCSFLWKSPSLHTIPIKYLEDVLTEIKTGLGETFCVTRRSAGMPYIIQALVCTNHDRRKIVNHTMETLISICENKNISEDSKVGVVHALNVLRTLFRCSNLGDLVGPYVSRAIAISIVLFNSSSWPIRNSSTLLLSALVNRIFGVPRSSKELSWKNRMTGREFFQRYPELYETFLNEFKKFSPLDMRPSLYPTLLILARLYPSVNETNNCIFRLEAYIPYILKCAQSPVMKTRMLAATSIAPQVTQNKLVEHLYITYNELTNTKLKENTTHGLLLQMFSLVENLPKLANHDLNKLVTLTEGLLSKYDQFMNCSYVVQEVFLRCITSLWLQLDDLLYNSVVYLQKVTLESFTKFPPNAIGQSKYFESATLFLLSFSLKAQTEFSVAVYNIMKNKIHCVTAFEILNIILSGKPIEFCYGLEKYKDLYLYHEIIIEQLLANTDLIELVCQQCTIVDTLIDIKYSVLSNFTPALHTYFKTYESIEDFISKVYSLRRDTEIAQALICINKYLNNLESLDQSVLVILTQFIENVYYAQRSDDCQKACVDIIVDNYNYILIGNNPEDIKTFLKLWTVMLHFAEDNSGALRNCVWRLVKKDANCGKSFELFFDKFADQYDKFPSAILVALLCWSYLDVELPQDRSEGQVFEGEDTSEFKEHTIRQNHTLNVINNLTSKNPESMHLEINKNLQEWIVEEWTSDFDSKPTVQNLQTIGDFMTYAKGYYLQISQLIKKTYILKS